MSTVQKVRSSNFTSSEKGYLLRIIAKKYAAILQDRRTDRATTTRKMKAWKAIEKEYNASSTSNIYRSAICLRQFYKNIKTVFRRLQVEEQKEILLNPGSPPKRIRDPNDELLLSILNETSKPIPSSNGCYNIVEEHHSTSNKTDSSIPSSNIADSNHTIPNFQLVGDTCKPYPIKLQMPISDPLVVSEKLETSSIESTSDSEGNAKDGYTQRGTNCRKPTCIIKTLTSSDTLKKHHLLLDKRLALVDKQLESIDNENEFLARKRELELEILETELAIKRKQLAATLSPCCNNK